MQPRNQPDRSWLACKSSVLHVGVINHAYTASMFSFLNPAKSRMPEPDRALAGRPNPIPTAERHFVNGASLKPPYPAGTEIADFAFGCFWGAEKVFWQTPGVVVTAVGYQGGYTPNPTYEEVCSGKTGHAESVRVVFDPSKVS